MDRTSARSTDGQDQGSQHRWTGQVLAAPRRTSARSTDGQDQCSQHRGRRAAAAPLRRASGVADCRLGKERLPAPDAEDDADDDLDTQRGMAQDLNALMPQGPEPPGLDGSTTTVTFRPMAPPNKPAAVLNV